MPETFDIVIIGTVTKRWRVRLGERQALEEQLEVDQRHATIGHASNLPEACLGVKGSGTCGMVVGVEPKRVCRPRTYCTLRRLDQESADPLAFPIRCYRQVVEVDGPRDACEVARINRPGFLGGEPNGSNDLGPASQHKNA